MQFDKDSKAPYVEIKNGDGFDRKEITLGVSDGIHVEIKSGISKEDAIKVWNEIEKDDDNNNG